MSDLAEVTKSGGARFARVVVDRMTCPGSSHPDYPLLKGDLIREERDGAWLKIAPGLGVGGFVLPDHECIEFVDPDTLAVVIL